MYQTKCSTEDVRLATGRRADRVDSGRPERESRSPGRLEDDKP